jgi:hypothetical protein
VLFTFQVKVSRQISDKVNKLRFGQVNLLKQVTKRKWVNAVALPFNSKSYSTGNPSIDKEEKHFILHPICLVLLELIYGK